ncbi:MAG: hypothetical protein LBR79_01540 [Oscillospiraceae bacterium]|nr:hypothetical protein [Oscillospiraceae bacterium]
MVNIAPYLKKVNLFLQSLPHRWREGLCLKIVEIPSFTPAMGRGKKILLTNLDHHQNINDAMILISNKNINYSKNSLKQRHFCFSLSHSAREKT